MLRYILLKLPALTSKTDYSVSSTCNQLRLLRPITPVKREARSVTKRGSDQKLHQRRSYSFPSTKPRSNSFLDNKHLYGKWTNSSPRESDGPDVVQKKLITTKGRKCIKKSYSKNVDKSREYTSQSKKIRANTFAYKRKEVDKLGDDPSYVINQYELEAAKPRKSQSELLFNVFDYIPNDPVRYLQPNKQRPFGSTDTTYLPLVTERRPINFSQFNTRSTSGPQDLIASEKNDGQEYPLSEKSTMNTDLPVAPVTDYYYINKKKEHVSKELAACKDIIQKRRDLNPSYITKKLSPRLDEKTLNNDSIEIAEKYKVKLSEDIRKSDIQNPGEIPNCETKTEKNNNVFESYRLRWNEPGIKIEPPPFLNSSDICTGIDLVYSGRTIKASISDSKYLQVPWPAYSERIKQNLDKHLPEEPIKTEENPTEFPAASDNIQITSHQKQVSNIEPLHIRRENLHSSSKVSIPPLEYKSIDNVREAAVRNEATTSKSSTFLTKTHNIQPVTPNTLSLTNRKMYTSSSKSAGSTPRKQRVLEPPSCEKVERKKCFLPSKVRLPTPPCLIKPPYRECVPDSKCSPRADQCYKILPKKLPVLQVNKCPCVEPYVPETNPKMKRLKFQLEDPPRICPCVEKCPCPPRADDTIKEKKKRLPLYKPGNCECIEPPPMQDVPLIRLKKLCEPAEKCYPKPECPKPDPCVRADDGRKDCSKVLPVLQSSNCPCVEPFIPDKSPRLQRLRMILKDTPRECPCNPCPCPPRADDTLKQKIKKLPIYKPGFCACVEPPDMIDVPLKRLVKVCPPEICNPERICPVEVCEPATRADFCLKEKPKKLPVLKATKCICVEPEVPDKNPKMKRLKMVLKDDPRICPPEHICSPRADDTLKPKAKRLPVYVPGECKCIEPSPLIDVPLVRPKKVCEPEEKCYPPIPCYVPPTCKEKPRADDNLCVEKKILPQLKANACPCIEPPPMTDSPKLKRLDLHVPEPIKSCPRPTCGDFPRADDNLKEKKRKLPIIKPGDCPCVEQPIIDVKPLPRLKCKDEEVPPCICDDPCIPYPRADWGCWEYNIEANPKKSKKTTKKKKKVTVNTKRRYNTDSRLSLCSKIKSENKTNTDKLSANEILNSNNFKDNLSLKSFKVNKLMNKEIEDETKSSALCNKLHANKAMIPNEETNFQISSQLRPKRSTSLPTIKLIKKLDDLEKGSSDNKFSQDRNIDLEAILSKLSNNTIRNKSTINTNIRKLSTEAVRHQGNLQCPISTVNIICSPKMNSKNNRCSPEETHRCKLKQCKEMVQKECLQKLQLNSNNERTSVYGGKKSTPFPAFSECTDEEVKPYSRNITHWSYSSSQNGFTPKAMTSDDNLEKKQYYSTTALTGYQHANLGKIQDGYRTLQFNSSHILCPRGGISRTYFSTAASNIHIKDASNQCTRYESTLESKVEKSVEKNHCKKIEYPECSLSNFPPKEGDTCEMVHAIYCNNRYRPYQAFYVCNDNKLEKAMTKTNLERWPPINYKSFCAYSCNKLNISKKEFCTFGNTYSVACMLEHYKESFEIPNSSKIYIINKTGNPIGVGCQEYNKTILPKLKGLYVRNYHILCNNVKRNAVDDADKTIKAVPQNQFTDIDEPKYMKLRNVQWRMDNFQKWRRLNKLSALQNPIKRYHTCSKLKYRHFIKYPPRRKKFSTCQYKNISEFSDLYALRGMPNTIDLVKQKSNSTYSKRNKHPFFSKKCNVNKQCPKFRYPNCPPRERFICKRKRIDIQCEKVVTPYPAFSECHDEEIRNIIMECPQERIQRLQPQYPLVPEIETVNLPPPPYRRINPNLQTDCLKIRLGLTNEGASQDYESFGLPIKCRNVRGFTSSRLCPETKKAAREKKKRAAKSCPKKEKVCTGLKSCPTPPKPVCPPKQVCKEETLWDRIVNYFKARPNCPAPDEWKKRALREKAERAAKAAGLCLIDPKDIPRKPLVCKDACKDACEELPKVITPPDSNCESEQKSSKQAKCSVCPCNTKNTIDSCESSNRRSFCTTSKRYYSQNVNWKYFEDFNKLVEEDKNKGKVDETFTSVMEKTNSVNETTCNKDDDVISPDSYCLKVFNEAILNKNRLNDITKYVDTDIKDKPMNYSLEILTKNKQFMDIIFNKPVDEFTNYSQSKAIAAFQEYINKVESFSEISYEDIENSKTKNLIKELNKLLTNKEE